MSAMVSRKRTIEPTCDPGDKPRYKKLPLESLVIDGRYQRRITKTGWRRIRLISRDFRWDRFGALLVGGPDKLGDYAVMDGQHRLEALKLRPDLGDEAPCLVAASPRREAQAGVFAGINADRVGVTRINVFWARYTEGDEDAAPVLRIAEAAGVTISRIGTGRQKPGCTVAWRAIRDAANLIGEALTVRALNVFNRGQEGCENALTGTAIKAMTRFYGLHHQAIDDDHMVLQLAELDMDDVISTARGVRQAFGGKVEAAVMKQIIQAYNRGRRGGKRLAEN